MNRRKKPPLLLGFAEKICDWLQAQGLADGNIMLLNKLQIVKRRRKLNPSEIVELAKLTVPDCPPNIRCGAYLLLDDQVAAQGCFDEMDKETQKTFLTYPICFFGSLQMKKQEVQQVERNKS